MELRMQSFRDALDVITRDRGLAVETFSENHDTGNIDITLRTIRPFEGVSREYIRSRISMFKRVDSDLMDLVDELYHRSGR